MTADQLAQAVETLIRRLAETYPAHYPRATLAEVRAHWSLPRLLEAHAQVWFTGERLTLQALSAYHAMTDAAAFHVDLPHEADDATLGRALLDVWTQSPVLTLADLNGPLEAPSLQDMKTRHDLWRKRLAERHGAKSDRKLLTDLRHCRASRLADRVEFEATDHERLAGWSGSDSGPLVLPLDADAPSLGAALRNTMAACKQTYLTKKRR